MSSLESKLALEERPTDGHARARLHHLLARWGCRIDVSVTRAPERVEVELMLGRVEVWKRIGGVGGKDTLYELDEVR